MLAYEFAEKRWCAFSADDRFHICADRTTTLCGIGWATKPINAATKADWTQCALCAHEEAKYQEVWELSGPDSPCHNRLEVDTDGATGRPEE